MVDQNVVDPRLAELAYAYLDDQLAQENAPQFEKALLEDEVFRSWFAQQVRRETAIREVLVQQKQAKVLSANSRRLNNGRSSRHLRVFRAKMPIGFFPAAAAMAALLVLGVGALVLMQLWDKPASGAAVVIASNAKDRLADGTPITPGLVLPAGAHVHLNAFARVRFTTGATLDVDEDSSLVLRQDGCDVTAGIISLQVEPQPADRPFRITTPQATLSVVGTRFSVDVSGQDTHLMVTEGIVEMRTPTWTRRVTAGGTALFPEPPTPTSPLASAAPAAPAAPAAKVVPKGVLSVSLYDAVTNLPIPGCDPLVDGATVDRALFTTGAAGLHINVASDIVAVITTVQGPSRGRPLAPRELHAPFTYPRDVGNGELDQSWVLKPGAYRIRVRGFTDTAGRQPSEPTLQLRFTVVDQR
jgi:ferric-dicitrate binding protein FerR (iron transport regulator)